ncbi:MAG: prepilin peptidase [Myxococcota bacterium]
MLLVLMLGAVWTDVRTQKIRNVLTFPTMLVGVAMAPLFAAHWSLGVVGLLATFAVALPGFMFGGAIRAGDVKMLAAAGSLLGPEAGIRAALFTYLLILPVGMVILVLRGRVGNLKKLAAGEKFEPTLVAHAPVIAVSILLARLQPWPDLWK